MDLISPCVLGWVPPNQPLRIHVKGILLGSLSKKRQQGSKKVGQEQERGKASVRY